MYNLLSGSLPFNVDDTAEAMFTQILACKYDFPPAQWSVVSDSAIDLVSLPAPPPRDSLSPGAYSLICAAAYSPHPRLDSPRSKTCSSSSPKSGYPRRKPSSTGGSSRAPPATP